MATVSAAAIITRYAKDIQKVRDELTGLLVTTSVNASAGELRAVADAACAVMTMYKQVRDKVVAEVPGSIMAAILADALDHSWDTAEEWTVLADKAAQRTGGTP